jgi:NADH-quinone oxidoreductase subunit L
MFATCQNCEDSVMLSWLLLGTIGLPWIGAVCVWRVGDRHPHSLLHTLATFFAVISGLAALGMIPMASSAAAIRIPIGGILGDFTLVPDGLGILIAVIATVLAAWRLFSPSTICTMNMKRNNWLDTTP